MKEDLEIELEFAKSPALAHGLLPVQQITEDFIIKMKGILNNDIKIKGILNNDVKIKEFECNTTTSKVHFDPAC